MLQSTPVPYVRDAEIVRVIDADTLQVRVDLGWRVHLDGEVRLLHVNAPEKNTTAGRDAIFFVNGLIAQLGPKITLATYSRDPDRSFTRYLAEVALSDGSDLADLLIMNGHGVPYP